MAPIEKREVNSLPEGEQDSYKNIDELKSNDDLKREINDDFFDKLESGDATIERHKGTLIIKIRDKNALSASMVNINGEAVGGYAFRIKERTLKNFLEKEQTTAETAAYYNTLLNKLQVVKNTQNELLDIRQDIDFNIDVTKQNLLPIINSLMLYYSDINTRMPRTFSRDSRKGFLELKNKAASRYKILKNIKYDLERRSYSDITQYINKTKKYLEETQEFDHNWQKVVMKQYPGDISVDINNTTDAKKEKRYQQRKFNKNNKFNSELENAEILDESNEIMEVLQQEIINDLEDTKNLVNNSDQFGKNRIMKQLNEFENTIQNVKSMKELRENIVGIIYQIEELEKKHMYQNKVKEKIKIKINGLKIKYKRKINYTTTKNEMIKTGSYQKMKQKCHVSGGADGVIGDLLVDGLSKMGRIDKNNSKQVDAIKKGGKYIMIGGALVLGFKFLQNLFSSKDKNKNKWRNSALYGGGLFALLNADGLMNRGKDLFSGNKTIDKKIYSNKTNIEEDDVQEHIVPQFTTMAAIGSVPINTLINQKLLIENGGNIEIDYKLYKQYLEASKLDKKAKAIALANLEKINQDKSLLKDGLNTFGIKSLDDMKKISNNDDKITLFDSEKISNYLESISSPVNQDLEKDGLKPVDSAAWYTITQEFDKDNTNNDDQIVDWIKRGLIEPKNTTPYNWEKMKNNPKLDINNKKIRGLEVKFDTYDELFNAMNLTDTIKKIFKDKKAIDKSPFTTEIFSGNIQFDNTRWYEIWKNETDVINANFYQDTLDDISESLSDNKSIYVSYLNNRWNKTGSVEK